MNNYQAIEYCFKCFYADFRISHKKILCKQTNVRKPSHGETHNLNYKKVAVHAISSIIGKRDIDKILGISDYYAKTIIVLNQREKEYSERLIAFIYKQANIFAMNDFENFI